MLKYQWYADAYNWPPSVVDELWEDEDYWLPIVHEARSEVAQMKSAEAQNSGKKGR